MKRPSRGDFESATMRRYDGCFFAPVRRNLILTAKVSPSGELFHHLKRSLELLDELVDVLHARAASRSDTPPAARIEDARIFPLGRRHRADDRFAAAQRLLVNLAAPQQL